MLFKPARRRSAWFDKLSSRWRNVETLLDEISGKLDILCSSVRADSNMATVGAVPPASAVSIEDRVCSNLDCSDCPLLGFETGRSPGIILEESID